MEESKELWELAVACVRPVAESFVHKGMPFPGVLMHGEIDMSPPKSSKLHFSTEVGHKGWYEIGIRRSTKDDWTEGRDTSPLRVTFPISTNTPKQMAELVQEALRPPRMEATCTVSQVLSCIQWYESLDYAYDRKTVLTSDEKGRWHLNLGYGEGNAVALSEDWPDNGILCIEAFFSSTITPTVKAALPKQSPWLSLILGIYTNLDYCFSCDSAPEFFPAFVRYAWHTWNNGGQFFLPMMNATLDEGGSAGMQYGGPRNGNLLLHNPTRSGADWLVPRIAPRVMMYATSTEKDVLNIIFQLRQECPAKETYGHGPEGYAWPWLRDNMPDIYGLCQTQGYRAISSLLEFMQDMPTKRGKDSPYHLKMLNLFSNKAIIYTSDEREEYLCHDELTGQLMCLCANRDWSHGDKLFRKWQTVTPWATRWIPNLICALKSYDKRHDKDDGQYPTLIDGIDSGYLPPMSTWKVKGYH